MINNLVGRTLANTYRIDQLLGQGGMGAVYRARDVNLNRDVAIKVMHGNFSGEADFIARFQQEARAIAALNHPGIVQVYASGQEQGMSYIVMDFIPGGSLQTWLKKLADERKIIALFETLDIVRRVALALYYAHQKGIYHRDIKPANIMLKPTDPALREPGDLPFQPVLTDFGLAKLTEGGIQTSTGMTMGTPAYMSPEQCMGLDPDPGCDIYSLGIVLYQMATGRVPFDVKSLTEAIRRHTQEPPPPPRSLNPNIPPQVEAIILRALAKRREDRFANARDMAEALKQAMLALRAAPAVAPVADQTVAPPAPEISLMTRVAQESATADAAPPVWSSVPAAGPGPQLMVVSPDGASRPVPLQGKRTLTVGRTEGNDIPISDPNASRHHVRIDWDGSSLIVTDLNSTNGTFLGNSRLLPGVAQPWLPETPLRIGGHWLRFEPAQAAPLPQPAGAAARAGVPQPPADLKPTITLDTPTLSVQAGQSVTGRLRILNQGNQVDHFNIALDGIPSSWVEMPAAPLRLTPHEEGTVTLNFRPPRESSSHAGAHPFTLRVASQTQSGPLVQATGSLTIHPFYEFTAQVAPQQIDTGQARLELLNQSNTSISLSVSATDPAEALLIQVAPQIVLQAGEAKTLPLQAQPKKKRPLLGSTQRMPFEVSVASMGRTIKQPATLLVRPIIPGWLPPIVGLLLLLLCVGSGLGYKWYTDNQNATVTADAATAIAAATSTAVTDSDKDGLSDAQESQLGTDPLKTDTDGDGLSDKEELDSKTDPLNPDTDGDGLRDGDEIAYGANPRSKDTDGDTLPDGQEVQQGTSPIRADTDGDGVNDNVDPDPGKLPTATPTPTLTPTPTSTPLPSATPTHTPVPEPEVSITTDHTVIDQDETLCATLNWEIKNAQAVYLNSDAVAPKGSKEVCPDKTTTYTWSVIRMDGAQTDHSFQIEVFPLGARIEHFAGRWNVQGGDVSTAEKMTGVLVEKIDDKNANITIYRTCSGSPCNLGPTASPLNELQLKVSYGMVKGTRRYTLVRTQDGLQVEVVDDLGTYGKSSTNLTLTRAASVRPRVTLVKPLPIKPPLMTVIVPTKTP